MTKTIYAMQHNVTKRIYVGTCNRADCRIKKHMHDLLRGSHTNKELQKDFDQYGMEFSFYILEEVEEKYRMKAERAWQNALRSNEIKTGYNLALQEKPITDLSKFERVYLSCVRGSLAEELGVNEKEETKKEGNNKFNRSYSNFERILSEKGITPYRVATDLGFSPMLLSDWKQDKSKPKYDTMVAIVSYLSVDMEQFTDPKPEKEE